jgi:DNA-binding NarL/FixJ family response regulator
VWSSPVVLHVRTVGHAADVDHRAANSDLVVPDDDGALTLPTDVIEILIRLGETRRAEQGLEFVERWASSLHRPIAKAASLRCRALLAAARGDLARALDDLCAARAAEPDEASAESARTLLATGTILRRLGRSAEAREVLARALELFERDGAVAWASGCRTELDVLDRRRGRHPELTWMELRVAEHAAAGLTNRGIAARLQVSQRAVEAHLSNVYGKLGIGSRRDLVVLEGTAAAHAGRRPA